MDEDDFIDDDTYVWRRTMRGITNDEVALLAALQEWPVEFSMCNEDCEPAESFTGGDNSISRGLVRDGRIESWPCKRRANFNHGRITQAGVLALRLRRFL